MSIRRLLTLTLSVSAVAALAGCGSTSSPPTGPASGESVPPSKVSDKSKHKFPAPPPIQPIK